MAEAASAPPAAEQDLAAPGVFQGIRKQVADHLLQQSRIAAYRKAAGNHAQSKTFCLRVVGEFVLHALEQIVDRELDHFGANGARLDLVYVEQRVQHARHGAHRVIEPRDQILRFLAFDDLRQLPLEQDERLQGLAQVMTGGGEKARLCGGGQLRLVLGRLQRTPDAPALGDVDKGDDDAFDSAILGAIGQYAPDVPGSGLRLDLSLERVGGSQHRAGIRQTELASLVSELRSASGRPMSPGRMLKSSRVAGVKKRMLRLGSRKSVATSVL